MTALGSTDFERLSHAELAGLDKLLAPSERWNAFYADRARPCPFFVSKPDECLVEWIEHGLLRAGRAADIGCGHARNAIHMARSGFDVDAIDYAQTAIDWAAEAAKQAGVALRLQCTSVFDARWSPGSLDLVCDSGCFHHLPPHRRHQYVDIVVSALKPGGWFAMTCFRPEGGSGLSDSEVYAQRSLRGGLGYTEERLREIWGHRLDIRELRQMREQGETSAHFGKDFLWALLAQKP